MKVVPFTELENIKKEQFGVHNIWSSVLSLVLALGLDIPLLEDWGPRSILGLSEQSLEPAPDPGQAPNYPGF